MIKSLAHIGRALPARPSVSDRPDWIQANPVRIERALARALERPTGGWYVLDASYRIRGETPQRFVVEGQELVAWREGAELRAAPGACPHMGADLSGGCVKEGRLVCPWHGLSLGPEGHGSWRTLPAFDDGVLTWVQLPEAGEEPTDRPIISPRPSGPTLSGVMSMEGACEPQDVVANRLDPWHGVHFHPHSFAQLRLLEVDDDALTLRVSYRVVGPLCVEVDATFHSPDPRTITMTIVDGEGVGSVVETHATPIGPGRSRVIEATIATSDRPGFRVAKLAGGFIRQMIEKRAGRLWVEDTEYAERRYARRTEAVQNAKSKRRLEAVR
ncbi:MAG: Rieske 2Fe-2S domain-containing protein [Deltaproteobacteria bacterium]|nr:Rieske 2Fe-2S domain-containing protein [Deltaproteobacteria bacterium]